MLTTHPRLCTRLLCLALLTAGVITAGPSSGSDLTVDRVALYMRHGVRSPTRDPPAPPDVSAAPWPKWSVPPGALTAHGAAGVRVLGNFDRGWLVAAGLLPAKGCPAADRVWVHADSEQRTIATGDEWLASIAPGCALKNEHGPEGEADPMFRHAGEFDAQTTNAAVAAMLGPQGIEGLMDSRREALATLDRILCGDKTTLCGAAQRPTVLVPASAGRGIRLSGALAEASTLSQVLVLEYAEGFPPEQVGWGRATAQDIQAVGIFHSTQYLVLGRHPYLAARYVRPIAERLLTALTTTDPGAPVITALIGHDSGIASLGGLLGLHWQVPGYAADDPPPGGALIYVRLHDAKGQEFVRISFRAQSLEQLRQLTPLKKSAPYFETLSIEGCAQLCPLEQFQQLLSGHLAQ